MASGTNTDTEEDNRVKVTIIVNDILQVFVPRDLLNVTVATCHSICVLVTLYDFQPPKQSTHSFEEPDNPTCVEFWMYR